jgi:hypothetical protein
MRSYLEIALRVACSAQPGPSEPNQPRISPEDAFANSQAQSNDLALCGSSDCAGCYDVGDGKQLHPPKCGEEYLNRLERWKPEGKVQ